MLTVAILGRVSVSRDGLAAVVPSGLTTELLVRLALDAGRPVRAERLVDDLWPGATDTPRETMQAKVSQLPRALGDPAALTGGPVGYTLAVDREQVDALRVLRLADDASARLASGDAAGAPGATDRVWAGPRLFRPGGPPRGGCAERGPPPPGPPRGVRVPPARGRLA